MAPKSMVETKFGRPTDQSPSPGFTLELGCQCARPRRIGSQLQGAGPGPLAGARPANHSLRGPVQATEALSLPPGAVQATEALSLPPGAVQATEAGSRRSPTGLRLLTVSDTVFVNTTSSGPRSPRPARGARQRVESPLEICDNKSRRDSLSQIFLSASREVGRRRGAAKDGRPTPPGDV